VPYSELLDINTCCAVSNKYSNAEGVRDRRPFFWAGPRLPHILFGLTPKRSSWMSGFSVSICAGMDRSFKNPNTSARVASIFFLVYYYRQSAAAESGRIMDWLLAEDNVVGVCHVPVLSTQVKPAVSARVLRVVIDSQLSLSAHITALCRSGYYQLRQLRPNIRLTVRMSRRSSRADSTIVIRSCTAYPTTCCKKFNPCRMPPHVWLLEPGSVNASLQSYRSCTGILFVEE